MRPASPSRPTSAALGQLARDELAGHRQLIEHDGQIAAPERGRPDVLGQPQRNLVHDPAPVRLDSVPIRPGAEGPCGPMVR